MVYAETKEKYDEFYQDLLSDATAKKYPKFVRHLERQYLLLTCVNLSARGLIEME